MKRKPRPKRTFHSKLPTRRDWARRHFLRQLTVGAGAIFLVGLPDVSRAQESRVNFYRIDGHPEVGPLAPSDVGEGTESDPPDDPLEVAERVEDPLPVDDPPPVESRADMVEEQRALWIDDGYLVLIRWSRPEHDRRVISTLEDSASVVREFLSASVTSTDQLHNLDRLHRIETELAGVLQRRVEPAIIEVLHLDHDCSVVCNSLDPSTTFPEVIEVDGEMPFPGWE